MEIAANAPLPPGPNEPPAPIASLQELPAWWGPELGETCNVDELLEAIGGARVDRERLELLAGQPVRRFLVCEHVSTTRWASVYVAIDRALDRHVVLKVSRRSVEPEPRLLASLAHPNIVVVHGVETIEGLICTVMEWCPEGNLASYARLYPLLDLLDRAIEVGRALEHLHASDVVHGDVKPTNILIQDSRAKLADFGLARRSTRSGEAAGTPPFMPPERFGGQWEPAGDVFSFAFTLTYCVGLCREVPGELEADLQRLLERGCAPLPELRPTMTELLDALNELRDRPQQQRDTRRDRRRAALFGGLLLVAASSGHLAATFINPEAEQPQPPTFERAMEYAKAGDPIAAWSEFRRADELAMVSAKDAVELAELVLQSAEGRPPEDREDAGLIAGRIARRASMLAKDEGDAVSRERAQRVRASSRKIMDYYYRK